VKQAIKNQFTFLLFGLGFWLPVVILIFVITFVLSYFEDFGRKILLGLLPANYYHTGFGILSGMILLYVSGVLLKLTRIRTIFSRIPFIGIFFSSGEVITIERLLHLTPCLFLLSPTCISYGWVLSEEKVRGGRERADFPLLNVYYPNVPTLLTGQVFAARKETVIKLGNSSKEIIDLLLYSFRSPDEIKYLPWEDESPEEFAKRAGNFGLNISLQ
jgi:uncharacterized membrane protein